MSANPIVMLVAAIHSVAAFTTARLSKINKPRMPGFLRRRSSLALSVSNPQELDKSQRLAVLTDEIHHVRASHSRNQHQQRLRRLRATRHRKAAPVSESSASHSLPFATDIISETMGLEDEEEEGGPVGSPVDWSRMPSRSPAYSTKRECTWSESPLDHTYPPYPADSAMRITHGSCTSPFKLASHPAPATNVDSTSLAQAASPARPASRPAPATPPKPTSLAQARSPARPASHPVPATPPKPASSVEESSPARPASRPVPATPTSSAILAQPATPGNPSTPTGQIHSTASTPRSIGPSGPRLTARLPVPAPDAFYAKAVPTAAEWQRWQRPGAPRAENDRVRRLTHVGTIHETMAGAVQTRPCKACQQKGTPCLKYTRQARESYDGFTHGKNTCGACRFRKHAICILSLPECRRRTSQDGRIRRWENGYLGRYLCGMWRCREIRVLSLLWMQMESLSVHMEWIGGRMSKRPRVGGVVVGAEAASQ